MDCQASGSGVSVTVPWFMIFSAQYLGLPVSSEQHRLSASRQLQQRRRRTINTLAGPNSLFTSRKTASWPRPQPPRRIHQQPPSLEPLSLFLSRKRLTSLMSPNGKLTQPRVLRQHTTHAPSPHLSKPHHATSSNPPSHTIPLILCLTAPNIHDRSRT